MRKIVLTEWISLDDPGAIKQWQEEQRKDVLIYGSASSGNNRSSTRRRVFPNSR